MSEQECIEELCSKGWTRDPWDFHKAGWTIIQTKYGHMLRFAGMIAVMERASLADLLSATMPGSAAVTVATYFGLRAPGVEP